MTSAFYGRMELGRCVTADLGYVGCSKDVLQIADKRCSGRRECEISIPDHEFDSTKPCLTELKFYLQASYICLEVIPVDVDMCITCNYGARISQPSGLIPSIATAESGCGTPECPWFIQVLPGQRISIILMDFSTASSVAMDAGLATEASGCRVYATIVETSNHDNIVKRHTVCGGKARVQHEYTSATNAVEIRVFGSNLQEEMNKKHFLFNYTAVGCPNPPRPAGGWSRRDVNTATLGCNNTSDTWSLRCQDTVWVGTWNNCSAGTGGVLGSSGLTGITFPSGLSILIILTISVALGIVIFGIGLIFLRRRHRGNQRPAQHTSQAIPPPPPVPVTIDAYGKPIYHREYAQNKQNFEKQHFGTLPSGQNKYALAEDQEKNEYCHIWQMPLPQPQQQHSESQLFDEGAQHYDDYTSSINSGNYEAVPPGGFRGGACYGTDPAQRFAGFRPEFELDNGEPCDDPRYFQLDPDLSPVRS